MKVCIVGANGKIGQFLVNKLSGMDGFQVRAVVRREEQVQELESRGIRAVVGNLEDPIEQIAGLFTGCDAIIFTAGSGSKTGPDKTLLVDLDGAVKTMEAAEKIGIKRYIMVSALQAHSRENWNEAIRPYYVAKHYADRALVASGLDYTIVRPGGLLDEPGSGKVTIAEDLQRGTIPREDVADTIIACLKEPKTVRRAFDLVSGDTSIGEAIAHI